MNAFGPHLTLGVIEVGWHSDDSLLDLLVGTQEGLGGLLHLDEDHGADLLGLEHLLLTLVLDCGAAKPSGHAVSTL